MKTVKIGIIGCGTIGAALGKRIDKALYPKVKVEYLCDADKSKAAGVQKKLAYRATICDEDKLIDKSDFVIEAASGEISWRIAALCLRQNKDALIVSIGGLVRKARQMHNLARNSKGRLYLPSGALCGIDGILAGKAGGITSATLTTRKPIKGLRGAPYFTLKRINIDSIKKEKVIYAGSAALAIRYFPKNVNVAALLSLVTLGARKTRVRLITSPHFTTNSHEVCVEGAFGRITTRTENVPSPTNPKTSYLAILSADACRSSL